IMTAVFIYKIYFENARNKAILFLLVIGNSQNLDRFWVISTPKSLTALKGIYIRVNPSILEKGWGRLIAWR
ncbi:MAG: hypothetical protein B7Z19_03855, partial [Polynucleobacter sp. 32-46-5]